MILVGHEYISLQSVLVNDFNLPSGLKHFQKAALS